VTLRTATDELLAAAEDTVLNADWNGPRIRRLAEATRAVRAALVSGEQSPVPVLGNADGGSSASLPGDCSAETSVGGTGEGGVEGNARVVAKSEARPEVCGTDRAAGIKPGPSPVAPDAEPSPPAGSPPATLPALTASLPEPATPRGGLDE